jgi:nitrite reductase/ring-hydroxylating ferredoxin subunit
MRDAREEGPGGDAHAPQPLVGFMSNDEWEELLQHVNALVSEMEGLRSAEVRERVFELLRGIDTIHREALRRLVRLFKEGVLEKVVTDPAIHTLMELYDLLPPDGEASPADAPRRSGLGAIPIKVVPATRPATTAFPHWVPVLRTLDELSAGAAREVDADDRRILLCRVADRCFALESRCARDGSSLEGARLDAYLLACPRHAGCFYDVRQGTRVGSSDRIECLPVMRDDGGRVLVGIGMPFRAELPSF